MKAGVTAMLAAALLLTGCAEKSEQWHKDKRECLAAWDGFKSPEELDEKCSRDADHWEKYGKPEPVRL